MNNISYEDHHKVVLVTGFGPFSGSSVNASGEAVKRLNKELLNRKLNITLIKEVVPVEYNYVHERIPTLWTEHRPHLAIHVGVSHLATGFLLEKIARKNNYCYPDTSGLCPADGCHPTGGPDTLVTDLEVEEICKEFNIFQTGGCEADISDDAGLFLCEYIYYTSLSQQLDTNKTSLFVHVPLVTSENEFQKLAQGLERIIEICVAHLRRQCAAVY